jgi:hypothetical protein
MIDIWKISFCDGGRSTFWRHDYQHNDIQHNGIQHNDIQHNNLKKDYTLYGISESSVIGWVLFLLSVVFSYFT